MNDERDDIFGSCPHCHQTHYSDWVRTGGDSTIGTHLCPKCRSWISPGIPTRLMATGTEVSMEVVQEIICNDCINKRKWDRKHIKWLLQFAEDKHVNNLLKFCAVNCEKYGACKIQSLLHAEIRRRGIKKRSASCT